MTILTSFEASVVHSFTIRQAHLLLQFVNKNSKLSTIVKLASSSKQVLKNIARFFEYIVKKDSVSTNWALNQRSFNSAIKVVTRKITDFVEWLKERRKIYEQSRSSSIDAITEISRISQSIRFTTLEISFKNKDSSKEFIRVSFNLLKNISKESIKKFLKKNKEKEISAQIEISFEQSTRSIRLSKSFQNFAESSQNFAESSKNISISKRTRNEISKIILQKLKNRHSKTFQNHRESSHFIISSSFNEADMTRQQQ